MKNNFDIGITTFSLRYNFVENLISKIRNFGINNNIFLCINGEKDSNFDEEYRKKILNLCSSYQNIFPIFFVEVRGLSKLWNTLLIHSTKDDILLLNDDIDLFTDNIFESVSIHIESENYFGLSKINGTFSYFVVNKNLIDELGYFDERLLGFGEEDGDITYRLIENKNKNVFDIQVNGAHNIISDIRHNHISPGIGKYSLFNRKFAFESKYHCHNSKSGIIGMFGVPCDKVLEDVNLYPYEKFFKENKNNL
jgi:hypothetical protein